MPTHRRQSQETRLELGLGVSIDSEGRTVWIADAHRDDGKRSVVRADEISAIAAANIVRVIAAGLLAARGVN